MPASGSRSTMRLTPFWAVMVAVLCASVSTAPGQEDPPPIARYDELAIYIVSPLHFGALAKNDGYVEIGPNDDLITDSNFLIYEATYSSAIIDVHGLENTAVSISIAGSISGGMVISNFHTSLGDPPIGSAEGAVLDAAGELRFNLGARLAIDKETASAGGNSIPYTISVIYE